MACRSLRAGGAARGRVPLARPVRRLLVLLRRRRSLFTRRGPGRTASRTLNLDPGRARLTFAPGLLMPANEKRANPIPDATLEPNLDAVIPRNVIQIPAPFLESIVRSNWIAFALTANASTGGFKVREFDAVPGNGASISHRRWHGYHEVEVVPVFNYSN